MDFDEWEPLYEEILHDFGFSREADERSAMLLESKVSKTRTMALDQLKGLIGETVTIFGCGPGLGEELAHIKLRGTLISAGGATTVLCKYGIRPDIMVTDLDGPIRADIECNTKGSVAVIHAHGDNMHLIEEQVCKFKGRMAITTQSRPFGRLINTGGFTDGDRAVMLARSSGAKNIVLVGFDFDRPSPKEGHDPNVKLKKLKWAKRLIFEFNPQYVLLELI